MYILKSVGEDWRYVGYTSDLKERFKQHNEGKVKVTRNYRLFELLARRRKTSQMSQKLNQIERLVDWQPIYKSLSIIDKSKQGRGGRPRKPIAWMVKAIFLQSLFNLVLTQTRSKLHKYSRIDVIFIAFCTFWTKNLAYDKLYISVPNSI